MASSSSVESQTRTKFSRTRTLGTILKAARTRRKLTIEEAEAKTRVYAKYLRALEEGRYQDMPAEAYNIGFVRSYAQALKLDPEKVVELYRQERSAKWFKPEENQVKLAPRRLGDWHFLITPQLLGIIGAVLLFGSVVTYISVQVHRFAQPPTLTITNLPEQFTTSRDVLKLVGSTSEGAIVAINSEPINVTTDGSFAADIQLSVGLNQIEIIARNRAEKETRRSVSALYQPDLAKAGLSGN